MSFTFDTMKSLLSRLLVCCAAVMVPMLVSAATDDNVLMVYGDSLSAGYGIREEEGWVNLLANKISADEWPYRVINGSVSGETTTGGLIRLPAMLESYEPHLVILELGGNDSSFTRG